MATGPPPSLPFRSATTPRRTTAAAVPVRSPTTRRPGRAAALLLVLVSGLGIAACGSTPTGRAGDKPAALFHESVEAVAKSPAVHLTGSVISTAGSTKVSESVNATSVGTGSSAGSLDLVGPTTGKGALGFNGPVRYVITTGTTYVEGGAQFWRSVFGAQTTKVTQVEKQVFPKLLNHWVKLSAASTATFGQDALGLANPGGFVSQFLASLKGTLSNQGNQELNGARGVQLSSNTGSKVLISASGTPLPLRMAATTTKGQATVTVSLSFSYPAGVTISAPDNAVSLATILEPFSKP